MSPPADSPDGSESVGAESGDDGQLTIRIPNPKVYMARQSQWKGRRGKPRCDHCRINNLKCDRVLPTCNHCQWANGGRECKYTPLPTPAHRGIPRCDRCRLKNLKCDRNLPVCNHCGEEDEPECNYTPKKRHKVPSDHVATRDRPVAPYVAKTASFLVSDPQGSPSPDDESNVDADGDDPMDGKSDARMNHQPNSEGKFAWGMILTTPHIDPWASPGFAPLPESVVKALKTVNAIEMPTRHAFDESLSRFLGGLAPELRETATFPAETYAELASAISEGRVTELSSRLRVWALCHHARSGSRKHHLILLPRDAFYNMNPAEEERLRANYIVRVDGDTSIPQEKAPENGSTSLESAAVFERVPVHDQVYDVLVYTHRNHGSASTMLFEARRIGIATITWPMVEMFIRLCPLCKLRAKGQAIRPVVPEEETISQPGRPVKR